MNLACLCCSGCVHTTWHYNPEDHTFIFLVISLKISIFLNALLENVKICLQKVVMKKREGN
jgi:hypothetical protein